MKRTIFIISFFFFLFSFSIVNAQVGINTDSSDPDASAMLDIKSIDKGMLIPRMTTAQRTSISNPANGLLVFDATTNSFWFYANAAWTELKSGASKEIADADNDTKIQVEESADEDIIRFDVAGTEVAIIDGKTFHFTSPGNSLFIGKDAGINDDGTGNRNVAIGFEALKNNTTGILNTANGKSALGSNTTGSLNTANGAQALFNNTTGSSNTANGLDALFNNTTGISNTANGRAALLSNTTGSSNTAIGRAALLSNTTGSSNTANGIDALGNNTTGSNNTAIGQRALFNNTTGSFNTANGQGALVNNTGTSNTAIGYKADVNPGNLTNATAIGANALVSQSNSLILGSNANVGIGTSAPSNKLSVSGNADFSGDVGIGTSTPSNKLSVSGNADFSGDVGIGTSTPSNKLSVSGNADFSGNVGIGTTSPKQKLHVDGDYYGKGHVWLYANEGDGQSGTTYLQARDDSGTSTIDLQLRTQNAGTLNDVMTLKADGKVEIGSGNIALTDSWLSNDGGNEGIKIMDNGRIAIGNANFISADGDDEGIKIGDSGAVGVGITFNQTQFSVKNTGNFGKIVLFATANNIIQFAIDSNGDMTANLQNNTAALPSNVVIDVGNNKIRRAVSSRRYKKNIKPANLAADVDKFLSLESKAFQFKKDPGGRYDYGFIAEEVDSLGLTNPLAHWKDGKVESIYFDHIAFYNFAALQQHRDRITVLEKSIDGKEEVIETLTNQQAQTEQDIMDLQSENKLLQSKLEKVEQLEQQFAELKAMVVQTNTTSVPGAGSDE